MCAHGWQAAKYVKRDRSTKLWVEYAKEKAGFSTATCEAYGGEPSVGQCQERDRPLRLGCTVQARSIGMTRSPIRSESQE